MKIVDNLRFYLVQPCRLVFRFEKSSSSIVVAHVVEDVLHRRGDIDEKIVDVVRLLRFCVGGRRKRLALDEAAKKQE